MEKIQTREDIMRMADAYRGSQMLFAAWDLGLFTALGAETLTSEEVAARVGADARATDRLLNALVVAGLTEKEAGRFRNTALGRQYLDRQSEDYLSNLGHIANLYKRWATLPEAVRHGGRVTEHTLRSPEETLVFIEAMHRRGRDNADKLIGLLDLSGVQRVLDVGGGSGVYSMAMCRARDGLTAVVFDVPQVTPLTRRYVAEAGMSERVTTMDGDYNEDDFGTEEFDLVFCSAIAHINSPGENQSIAERGAKALRPGGLLVVQDFVMSEDRLTPEWGAVFALNMLVNTQGGDCYTEAEIRGWQERVGLTDIQRINSGPSTAMIIGRKA